MKKVGIRVGREELERKHPSMKVETVRFDGTIGVIAQAATWCWRVPSNMSRMISRKFFFNPTTVGCGPAEIRGKTSGCRRRKLFVAGELLLH